MARSRRRETVDMKKIEKILDLLREGKRMKEAICLCYSTFVALAEERFGKKRPKHKTYREFVMELVKEGLDPALVYPFTTLYEEIRFGRRDSSQSVYMDAHKMMKRLEEELRSKSFSPRRTAAAISS
ncbi:MAG: DUF4129 domain-containing protein [Candidatus Helarchaeales archaeon]